MLPPVSLGQWAQVSMAKNKMSLNPTAIAGSLGAIAVLLVLASIGMQFSKFVLGHGGLKGLVRLFYIDAERNIPTYFSVLLMIFAALLLAVIALLNQKQRTPFASKWAVLSAGFLFMAFDEAFQVHEKLILPVRALLSGSLPDGTLGIFYFAWVIPGGMLVLFLGLFFSRFLLHLPALARHRFLTAATLYLGGAIGVELIGGRYAESLVAENWTYSLIVTVEESLEMAGLVVFIWALLEYCAEHYREIRFQFES